MEFLINRETMLNACSHVSKAIMPAAPKPVLSGILMDVKDGALTLTGSSSNLTIRIVILPGELSGLVIEEDGRKTVEAKTFMELMRRMEGATLRISEFGEDMLRTANESGQFDLVSRSAEDYPQIDLSRPETHIEMPVELLRQALSQVSYAAADRSTRSCLMGVNFAVKDGKLTAAASDSYRLATKTAEVESEADFDVTIPKTTLSDAVRILESEKFETVDLYFDRRKVQFMAGKILIQSVLYDGSFPNVTKIIPTSSKSTLTVNRHLLESMLSRACIYTNSNGFVPLKLDLSSDEILMEVITMEIGSGQQEMNAVYEGEPLVISFNARLMLDAVRSLGDCEDIRVDFNGNNQPIRITSPQVPDVISVIVPVRS